MALCLPGDTVLYLLLPMYVETFGVSLAQAGVLLAANRLIRLLGYGWVGRAYERHGPARCCQWAAIAAVAATLSYALAPGFVLLLVARLLWGLSFAALNLATQTLATVDRGQAARRNGISRTWIAAGPMIGLLLGAVMTQCAGPRTVFLLLAAAAAASLPLARRLPRHSTTPSSASDTPTRHWFSGLTRLDVWSFVQGFALDGVFIVGLSVLAQRAWPEHAAWVAGTALAARYFGECALGRLGGALAQRWSPRKALMALSWISASALVMIGTGWVWSGTALAVLARSLLQPLPAPVAVADSSDTQAVNRLVQLSGWRDLGAGLGPLLSGWALAQGTAWPLYLPTAITLAVATAWLGTRRSCARA